MRPALRPGVPCPLRRTQAARVPEQLVQQKKKATPPCPAARGRNRTVGQCVFSKPRVFLSPSPREQKRQTRRLTPADFLFGSIQQGDFVTRIATKYACRNPISHIFFSQSPPRRKI